jgi:hypothetical protein
LKITKITVQGVEYDIQDSRVDDLIKRVEKLEKGGTSPDTSITISLFKANKSTTELGESEITLSWVLDQAPTQLTITSTDSGFELTSAPELTRSGSVNCKLSTIGGVRSVPITLRVAGADGVSKSRTIYVEIQQRIYYGVAKTFNQEELNSRLASTCGGTLTWEDTAADQYVWYAYPANFGKCIFRYAGMGEGGFEEPLVQNLENTYGYKENYYIYRSTRAGLYANEMTVVKKGVE